MTADTELEPAPRAESGTTAPLATVLLATDGSAGADGAALVAAGLASRTGASLHVVAAWTPPVSPFNLAPAIAPAEFFEWPESHAGEVIDEAVLGADLEAGTSVTAEAVLGAAGDAVAAAADAVDADLVVVGSRGLSGVRRILLGSVADTVVRRTHRPVLVVRGEHPWPFRRIVAGVDSSPDATRAADVAALLARATDVPLELVGAVSLPGGGTGPGLELLRHAELAAMRQHLDGEVSRLGGRGISTHATVRGGDAAEVLLAVADDGEEPALVVVGRRGVGALHRALLGSVSNAVLHAARGSVLVVSHQDAPRA